MTDEIQSQEIATPAPTESKVFTQEELNAIAGRIKAEAYEKGKRDALKTSELPQQVQAVQSQSQISEEEIAKIVDQRVSQRATQQVLEKTADEFVTKLRAGNTKYSDFEEKVASLNLEVMPPEIWISANKLDNTADVMYRLAENPSKYGALLSLLNTAPHLVQAELKKLSESVELNDKAKDIKLPKEPLSQLKPSATGIDNGDMSVSSFKKYYARGGR